MNNAQREIEIQRAYYTDNASHYDAQNIHTQDEHYFALGVMVGLLDFLNVRSVLDIGAGTGRALLYLREKRPDIHAIGIEPVLAVREAGYSKGLSPNELIEGDGTSLSFPDNSFDLVCEFAVLHHIKYPEKAIAEMLRVARVGIFISDSNSAGQGRFLTRTTKHALRMLRLWPLANLIKTKGRGYLISDGDGLSYSFSVFDHYKQIADKCKAVHLINTQASGVNLYRSAGHVALLGRKS